MKTTPTLIIGAGPAGLAVGACLQQRKLAFEIVEQSQTVGDRWRNHYDRLHLHTSRKNSALPGMHFPRNYPKYPSREQVVAYFTDYAAHFHLNPHFGTTVYKAERHEKQWIIETNGETWGCQHLVVANGLGHTPHIPHFKGQETFPGIWAHSSTYRNGASLKGKRVLVIGFGNSGGEIAIDLGENGAHPALAVRGSVNIIPKEVMGIPSTDISLLTSWLPAWLVDRRTESIVKKKYGDLRKWGLEKSAMGPREQVEKTGRIPLIDIGTMDWIMQGKISVFPGIERVEESWIHFSNGQKAAFDAVILATGYKPSLTFLEGQSFFQDGIRDHIPPVVDAEKDLYFCGFRNPTTGALRGMGKDARKIAAQIAKNQEKKHQSS